MPGRVHVLMAVRLAIEPMGKTERRLATKNFRDARLQAVDGRVLGINVVADFGLGHRAAHGGRRTSNSIAAQVNDGKSKRFQA